ncbi:ECF transporter S component [Adlercreutzia faecimuris]|uniref:ECF transporter S component n=1 Tax=Adlercreutzia faecimuris TaxID=2897341 RepID=A0ABS9WE69_9ACTN|nr:ECF transporter S component [Adlercreutzia sp. JBNU-10]MCI2241165.1 ECF transporter S component [Adlercreutzia sp. JBNU-10]
MTARDEGAAGRRFPAALEALVLLAVPVALVVCGWFQFDQTALLTFAVAAGALGLFFAGFERSRPALRQVVPTAVLGALAAAGRILFAATPDVKPVSAVCILAGAVFGRRCGFMVGALAAVVSNFFFGQGPWTPWQMYAWGLVGYLAGVLADAGLLERRGVLMAYGFASGLLFGLLMNSWTLVGFTHPITWQTALLVYGAGLPFDLVHAVSTVVFLLVIYVPWRRKLLRVRDKFAL